MLTLILTVSALIAAISAGVTFNKLHDAEERIAELEKSEKREREESQRYYTLWREATQDSVAAAVTFALGNHKFSIRSGLGYHAVCIDCNDYYFTLKKFEYDMFVDGEQEYARLCAEELLEKLNEQI